MMKWIVDFRPHSLLFAVLFTSCHSEPFSDCVKSSGPEIEITRNLSTHPGALEVKDDVDVVWHRSDSSYLVLTCGRNLSEKVTTELHDGILTIRNINRCNWVREYNREMKVDVYCREPNALYLKGYGDFRTADTLRSQGIGVHQFGAGKSELWLNTKRVNVEFNCIGQLELKGSAQTANYFTLDVGIFKAEMLKAKTVEMKMEGDNDVWIEAQDSLKGTVLTERTVFYKGSPKLAVTTPKGGKLVCVGR